MTTTTMETAARPTKILALSDDGPSLRDEIVETITAELERQEAEAIESIEARGIIWPIDARAMAAAIEKLHMGGPR